MTSSSADDTIRLAEWIAHVQAAGPWLSRHLGVDLDGTAQSLFPLWAAAMPRVAFAGPEGVPDRALPAWARWPELRPGTGRGLSAETLNLAGAVAAYYGQVLISRCPPPRPQWQVLRHPVQNVAEEGHVVVAPPAGAGGVPPVWVSPLRDVLVLATAQVEEPVDPRYPIVGKDDPRRLCTLLQMRLEELS